MNHPRALGAADNMDSLASHLETRGSRFWPGVGGANGQREFGKGTRGSAAITRKRRKRTENFFYRELHADDASRADKHLLRREQHAARSFFIGAKSNSIAENSGSTIGVARV